MLARFTGTVEPLCPVLVEESGVVDWISAIPLSDWPQQNKPGLPLKPSMVTDTDWYDLYGMTNKTVERVMRQFPGCVAYQRMLSCVMPGDEIEPHRDQQAPYWLCRVHVPLTTNEQSEFIVDGQSHQMKVGTAYRVNTLAEHSVVNAGASPRIHFMFDIRK